MSEHYFKLRINSSSITSSYTSLLERIKKEELDKMYRQNWKKYWKIANIKKI